MPHRVVMKTRKDTSHGLHLVLTLLIDGVWGLIVWFPPDGVAQIRAEAEGRRVLPGLIHLRPSPAVTNQCTTADLTVKVLL
jgi:hypothetical protein